MADDQQQQAPLFSIYRGDAPEPFFQSPWTGMYLTVLPENGQASQAKKLRVTLREPLNNNSDDNDSIEQIVLDNGDVFYYHVDAQCSAWTVQQVQEDAKKIMQNNVQKQQQQAIPTTIQQQQQPPKQQPIDKTQVFLQMLHDLNVSPFATWSKELPRLCQDERFGIVPDMDERKSLFQRYLRQRLQQAYDAKVKKQQVKS